jgi:hypothetical protein
MKAKDGRKSLLTISRAGGIIERIFKATLSGFKFQVPGLKSQVKGKSSDLGLETWDLGLVKDI